MSTSTDLIVPVYLNQTIVFDLLAMLQGGISTVVRISETQRVDGSVKTEAGGAFGLGQALASLLKIELAAKASSSIEGATGRERSEERIHTPASLLFTLRQLMIDRKILAIDSSEFLPKPGAFVEFSSSLRRNPVLESMDALIELTGFFSLLTESKKKGGQPQGQVDVSRMKKQMESVANALKAGETMDLTTGTLACKYRTVITLDINFLKDPILSDVLDGTFRVIGKITRVVPDDQDAINLLRKSAFSRMPPQQVETFMKMLGDLGTTHDFSFPAIEWKIRGPVFQVLPIAIFA